MRYALLLSALGLACAATLATAAPPGGEGHDPMTRFKQADTNGDGMISRDEAKALPMVAKHFDEIDANHDGQVTADELRAFHAQKHGGHHAKAAFKKLDTDGDGRISRAEAQASPRLSQNFDAIDANKDGFITPDELKAARAQHAAK